MNYQVLARKWRPASFESLVGQSHVVRALTNALDQQRLHHAYLFSGTRGVGKTTLGRILAKCLNCETGITSKPCNTCRSCQEIASGRFLDLIEVDAASRTKVEDTRELLENVSYAPTSGRFKVYFIDEVHMLSTHSYNALLKILEEPPAHVKFFLATTDPQKIPITVVSRCLQFHLKCLSPELIAERLAYILQQENITFEKEALVRLANAAEGSMRDALSLLDQAIAFNDGKVVTDAIKSMLSTIEATHIYDIAAALMNQHAERIIEITQELAELAVDFSNVLEELLSFLHQVTIAQLVKPYTTTEWDPEKIVQFAEQISPQDVQLFYQIGLIGRRDLPLAPTARIGLEMVLLRMLAFQPQTKVASEAPRIAQPVEPKKIPQQESEWQAIMPKLNLNGMVAAIASHCTLEKLTEQEIVLVIDPGQSVLLNKKQEERLAQALQEYFGRTIQLTIKTGEPNMSTPANIERQEKAKLQSSAQDSIHRDPNIKNIIDTFNAKIIPDSIEAKD